MKEIKCSKSRTVLGEIAFWVHLPIFLLWVVPFFIPESVVSWKTAFHFWYLLALLSMNYAWGLIIYPRLGHFSPTCPWTTFNQWIRGYPLEDRMNWDHSFVAELSERCGYTFPRKVIIVTMLAAFIVTGFQLFVF